MPNISIDDLAAEIAHAIQNYTEDVTAAIEKQADQTSKAMTQEIQKNSPRNTGEYAKGWIRKKVVSNGEVTYITYNKSKPWLAHLLENGHVKRGGGRVPGKPHIRPAEDRAVSEFEDRVQAIIRNGG